MITEIHIGCGGEVWLAHESWKCTRCGAFDVPVTAVRIVERTERTNTEPFPRCPACKAVLSMQPTPQCLICGVVGNPAGEG